MTALNLSLDEIKAALFRLPPDELMQLVAEIEERLQTAAMMHLAETGFSEWDDAEEDIYDAST